MRRTCPRGLRAARAVRGARQPVTKWSRPLVAGCAWSLASDVLYVAKSSLRMVQRVRVRRPRTPVDRVPGPRQAAVPGGGTVSLVGQDGESPVHPVRRFVRRPGQPHAGTAAPPGGGGRAAPPGVRPRTGPLPTGVRATGIRPALTAVTRFRCRMRITPPIMFPRVRTAPVEAPAIPFSAPFAISPSGAFPARPDGPRGGRRVCLHLPPERLLSAESSAIGGARRDDDCGTGLLRTRAAASGLRSGRRGKGLT